MKKHPVTVAGFDGTLEQLADAIHALRYDARAKLAHLLSERTRQESRQEAGLERPKLAFCLLGASEHERATGEAYERAFQVSKPFMREELKLVPPLL